MAKKKPKDEDSQDQAKRDALKEVMERARKKAAENEASKPGSNAPKDNSQFREGAEYEKQVVEKDIDPTAKKALKDLLGADVTSKQAKTIKNVKVYSPFRVYYDGEAASVSALNGTGPFDVLPGHKNFLTLLLSGDLVVRSPSGKEETIAIDRGIMHVRKDSVKVFLDV